MTLSTTDESTDDWLVVQADGSATALKWGTGVWVPAANVGYDLGGFNEYLGRMSEEDGSCDSSVAEMLAVIHACWVACNKCKSRHRSLRIIVDKTTWITNVINGDPLRPTMEEALLFVKRAVVRALAKFEDVEVVHKKTLGLSKNWFPNKLAYFGRESGHKK